MNAPSLSRRAALAGAATAMAAAMQPSQAQTAKVRLQPTTATTEGPYYFDVRQQRSDITEGLAGVPLEVRFTVLDVQGQPLKDQRVDVWHCNAQGHYSGYAGQGDDRSLSLKGKTFLRGHQVTGSDGVVAFRSIYPGWYAGRTTHIHFKVINGSRAVLTSQFFLPDALSEFLYTQLPQYQRAALRNTLNSNDGIALQAGETVIGAVHELGDRYVASLTLVVEPASNPVVDRPPIPGEGPAGGPPPGGPRPMRARSVSGEKRIAALVPGR